ncbi:serine hydrolase FSH [Aspergillus coremiiformis]|uniref:Serine hydrolase FSH n=1 Tax=Aspergillus coremiiformis TaxID=138285 RepID=A0A5N6ZGS7_9EURO|nr:serine hydrolase FSH [Aspergillus coremiiformis]
MPLKLLCLHGWGTNTKILQSQLSAVLPVGSKEANQLTKLDGLMADLRRDNTVIFHFLEGDVDSIPGPGISGYYDGPYYSYYQFPRSISNNEAEGESMLDAYDRLYEAVDEEGPFDGVLGFSHGGTLAAGFLIHHAKLYPQEVPPFRCAIFVNSLPPFRMNPGEDPVIDPDLEGYINIPTVNIGGAQDALLEYSLALHRLCNPSTSTWVVHSKGHDIPGDKNNVASMATAIRKLAVQVLAVW